MKMSDEQFKSFQLWLHTLQVIPSCPMCEEKMEPQNEILFFQETTEAGTRGVPFVYVKCSACMNTQFFSAAALGLV